MCPIFGIPFSDHAKNSSRNSGRYKVGGERDKIPCISNSCFFATWQTARKLRFFIVPWGNLGKQLATAVTSFPPLFSPPGPNALQGVRSGTFNCLLIVFNYKHQARIYREKRFMSKKKYYLRDEILRDTIGAVGWPRIYFSILLLHIISPRNGRGWMKRFMSVSPLPAFSPF